MKDNTIKAPFTQEQVETLNEFQQMGMMHPFTCMGIRCKNRLEQKDEGLLKATTERWVCPCGEYTQKWAHGFMADRKFIDRRKNSEFWQLNKGDKS